MVNAKKKLLREILFYTREHGFFPEVKQFKVEHSKDLNVIKELLVEGLLRTSPGLNTKVSYYFMAIDGLYYFLDEEPGLVEVEMLKKLVEFLKNGYMSDISRHYTLQEIADYLNATVSQANILLFLLQDGDYFWSTTFGKINLMDESIVEFVPNDNILKLTIEDMSSVASLKVPKQVIHPLQHIEIDGYRPFRKFHADIGGLTVIIGANASGKSSLFDFLHFVQNGIKEPLPPEIDERSVGKTLFHNGKPEKLSFGLTIDLGQQAPVCYEAEVIGPVGSPRVVREKLGIAPGGLGHKEVKPFLFLNFSNGNGQVQDPSQRRLKKSEWSVNSNEFALRRALDPSLATPSRVQEMIAAWRFFSAFDVSSGAAIRRPVFTEEEPVLTDAGDNLSAVMLWLRTEHSDVWDEVETHLRSAIVGFKSLNVKMKGGKGTVIGTWSEEGVKEELTLADLSDGTLRFLCWSVLCLSPKMPPLICIDEPELGLHPRVLPIVAGLLRLASSRTQLLVATHSPYLLSHFKLHEIAVMRKEDGAARLVRPDSSALLRKMVEEIGGEALTRLHLSQELEVLP